MYRKATWDDLEALTALYEKAHDAEEAGLITTGWQRGVYPTKATVEAGLERGDFFAAEADGKIVGAAVINHLQVDVYDGAPWEHEARDEEVMVLHTLFVDPAAHHKGLGRGFIAYYEDYARCHGCRELRIDTNERNLRARALYKSLGYKEIAVVPTVFNGIAGVGLVLLEKYLGEEKALPLSALEMFPPYASPDRIRQMLQKEIAADPCKIIVLDDDPTGVQTVHDVHVYTDWSTQTLQEGLEESNKLFYVLTNSRGMTVEDTTAAHREIAAHAAEAAAACGMPYLIISRSDSTMRGHYPLETDLLREGMEQWGTPLDGEILCPFFKDGGRYTIGNVHYVKQGEELVPAAQTEFAKDKTFGYSHSSIPEYIEEKTGGACRADEVISISLEDLRAENYDLIEAQLTGARNYARICVNAIDDPDLEVFCIALYRAMHKGRRFMFRTAAGFVKAIGGISDRPLLTREEMLGDTAGTGGIIVVGSHTAKTTAQLQKLLTLEGLEAIEFNSDTVLEGDEAFYAEVHRCVREEERILKSGRTAVCYTRRKLLSLEGDTKESALVRSVKISDGVQSLVGRLGVTPAFVVAKGGITSSDVGTRALKVRKALVLGQIMPGIPVWQIGGESRFPGIPYIIFPGNVGEEDTLYEAVRKLTGR